MLANIIHPKENKLANIKLDIIVSEGVNTSSTITENPVEYGADVSDHIITNPMTFNIVGMVSDMPMTILGGLQANGFVSDMLEIERPSIRAWNKLLELQTKREPFTLVTNLKSYENVAITSLSTAQDKDTSNILSFSAELQEVIMVGTQQITDKQFKEANIADGMSETKDEGVKDANE